MMVAGLALSTTERVTPPAILATTSPDSTLTVTVVVDDSRESVLSTSSETVYTEPGVRLNADRRNTVGLVEELCSAGSATPPDATEKV